MLDLGMQNRSAAATSHKECILHVPMCLFTVSILFSVVCYVGHDPESRGDGKCWEEGRLNTTYGIYVHCD